MIETHALILDWFAKEARDFPWRYTAPDPYHVLISEYMLQQTQAQRIAERFPIFISQFPDIHALANANTREIIMAWQGLGYNNRALRLRDCAKEIIANHEGRIPNSMNALIALPGIGPYTASAILSFAFGENVSVIDVNIRRVYARYLGYSDSGELSAKEMLSFAERAYPKEHSSAWHQAIMDIGAQWCKARQAICEKCPLNEHCKSAFSVQISKTKKTKNEPSHRDIPNRIWRGKTVEYLRIRPRHTEKKHMVLRALINEEIKEHDITWFDDLLLPSLIKDRLIEYDAKKQTISIPL